jgi:hypothetical protein
MKRKKCTKSLLTVAALFVIASSSGSAQTNHVFEWEGKSYPYTVAPAGDSFHFEFENRPDTAVEQYQAKQHVLQSVFDDSSIDFSDRQDYIRERARCSFFGGIFHDYTLCILPNEYSPDMNNDFKGFVTQLPNSFWLLSRIVLPAVLAGGLIYLVARRRAP